MSIARPDIGWIPELIHSGTASRDRGHDTGWRRMPWLNLQVLRGGCYRILLDGGGERTVRGDAILAMGSGRHHRYHCLAAVTTTWVAMRWSDPSGLDATSRWRIPLVPEAPGLGREIEQLHRADLARDPESPVDAFALGERCCRLLRRLLALGGPAQAPHPRRDELVPVLRAMRDDLGRPWSRGELAALAGLSPTRFHAVFSAVVGESPMRHLRRVRLDRALHLLAHGEGSIARIAHEVGFEDPYHFSRVFSQHLGCSPRAWRLRHHDGP